SDDVKRIDVPNIANQHNASPKHSNFKKLKDPKDFQTMLTKMSKEIEIKNRTFENQVMDKCFVGRDAITWMQNKRYVKTRITGLKLARKLQRLGYIQHAGGKTRNVGANSAFEDEMDCFYRLEIP
ncbi:hypothetical protein RFI_33210, partial [Reticulomyxa filosa]